MPEICRLIDVNDDFSKAFSKYDTYFENVEFLGDAMPSFRLNFGPDQFAAFLGAPIKVSEDGWTSWSEKIVDNWESFMPLKIDENNIYWKRMIEYHKAAEKYFAGKCLLENIDMHSNIDALEGLRGAQKLLFDMIDSPEIIHKAMKQVRDLYNIVYNELYKYGKKSEIGTTSWLHAYSRRKYNATEADYIGLLSPDMFRDFVMPALEEEAALLDDCIFHLDGPDALKHLDDILSIKQFDCIQWVSGAGSPPPKEWPEVLHKIQDAGKAIWLRLSPEEVKEVHKQYKPELMCYNVIAKSHKEAQELLDWLKKNT
jgi:hypothetical protein